MITGQKERHKNSFFFFLFKEKARKYSHFMFLETLAVLTHGHFLFFASPILLSSRLLASQRPITSFPFVFLFFSLSLFQIFLY